MINKRLNRKENFDIPIGENGKYNGIIPFKYVKPGMIFTDDGGEKQRVLNSMLLRDAIKYNLIDPSEVDRGDLDAAARDEGDMPIVFLRDENPKIRCGDREYWCDYEGTSFATGCHYSDNEYDDDYYNYTKLHKNGKNFEESLFESIYKESKQMMSDTEAINNIMTSLPDDGVDDRFNDFVNKAIRRGTICSKDDKYKYSNIIDIIALKNGVYIIYKDDSDQRQNLFEYTKKEVLENWYVPEDND